MDGDTEITGADSAPFTVTVTALEETLLEAVSVTLSSKLQDPAVDRTPVDAVGLSLTVQAKEPPRALYAESNGPFFNHWHVYVEVPPLNELVVERVDD